MTSLTSPYSRFSDRPESTEICLALFEALLWIIGVFGRATHRSSGGHSCSRCGCKPDRIVVMGSDYVSSPICFGLLCVICVNKIKMQIDRILKRKHGNHDATLAFIDADATGDIGTVVREELAKVRKAYAKFKAIASPAAASSGPTAIQCDAAKDLIMRVRGRAIGDVDRMLFDTPEQYKSTQRISASSSVSCFCCRTNIDSKSQVYSLGDVWAMCVSCRNALIPTKPRIKV